MNLKGLCHDLRMRELWLCFIKIQINPFYYVQSLIFVDRWLFLVGIFTCSNLACGVHLSVVPISSYKRNNGRRRFKRGYRAGFPLCVEVFVVWEITPTQRSFPISTVAARLLGKHISCSCKSTCSNKRTTERLSTHRRSLQAVLVDRQRSHVETK